MEHEFSLLGMTRAAAGGASVAAYGPVRLFHPSHCVEGDARSRIIDLYDSLRPSVHAYVFVLGIGRDDAEDIIQEAFLRLAQHLLAGGSEDNLRAWIFRVVHNLSVDLHRSHRRSWKELPETGETKVAEFVDPGPNPEQIYLENERWKRLQEGIRQLSPQQRSSVHLRAEGLRYREIAAVMGISVQRVGELVQRALVKLAGTL